MSRSQTRDCFKIIRLVCYDYQYLVEGYKWQLKSIRDRRDIPANYK